MNRTRFMLALVSFFSVALVASGSYAGAATGRSGLMMLNSSDLIGAPVKDSHGELMGVVQEVRVDSEGHALAIVNHGDYDLYGVSGVNTPVPFQELQISRSKEGQDTVVLKTDMEHLDFAPYLDPTKRFDRKTEANIYEYYGIQPYWTQGGKTAKSRLQELNSLDLIGAAVENSCGKVVGIVQEVMVDSEGYVFAIVNHGDYDLAGSAGINTPVPLQELRISQAKGVPEIAVLKTDMEHLDFAPYLNPAKRFTRQDEANIYEYFGITPYWMENDAGSR